MSLSTLYFMKTDLSFKKVQKKRMSEQEKAKIKIEIIKKERKGQILLINILRLLNTFHALLIFN